MFEVVAASIVGDARDPMFNVSAASFVGEDVHDSRGNATPPAAECNACVGMSCIVHRNRATHLEAPLAKVSQESATAVAFDLAEQSSAMNGAASVELEKVPVSHLGCCSELGFHDGS